MVCKTYKTCAQFLNISIRCNDRFIFSSGIMKPSKQKMDSRSHVDNQSQEPDSEEVAFDPSAYNNKRLIKK